MKRTPILLLLILLILSGCNEKSLFLPSVLPESQSITISDYFPLASLGITQPLEVVKNGKTLNIQYDYEKHNFIAIDVSAGTHKYFDSYQKNEQFDFTLNSLNMDHKGNIHALDYSGALHEISPATRSLGAPIQLPEDKFHISIAYGHNFIITTGDYEEGRYAYHSQYNHTTYYESYPDHPDFPQWDNKIKSRVYLNTVLRLKPDNTALVCADFRSGQIDFCRIQNGTITRIQQHHYSSPQVEVELRGGYCMVGYYKDNINGFQDLAVSDRYVYALYSGKNFHYSGDIISKCNILFVFDWNGELLYQYDLPYPVANIFYDTEEGELYGIGYTPDMSLVRLECNVEE